MGDQRSYIKVHDGIEDHPKIEAISDRAFRLLITTWGWCNRHRTDGRVPATTWRRRGTAKSRQELVAVGLAVETSEGVEMRDYLEHQTSAADIAAARRSGAAGGELGNHRRWHEGPNGTPNLTCSHCRRNQGDRSPPRSIG